MKKRKTVQMSEKGNFIHFFLINVWNIRLNKV